MIPRVSQFIDAMQAKAARLNVERARVYGAGQAVIDEAGLSAALAMLDGVKADLVKDHPDEAGREGWGA